MLHLAELSLTVGVGKNVQVYSKLYIKVKFRNNLLQPLDDRLIK